MKEVTYEEWLENPTPRRMLVWNEAEIYRKIRKVVYYSNKDVAYPVFALTSDEVVFDSFKHCAEIETEPQKSRRFTYKELSRWLREKPTREYKYLTSDYICHNYDYRETIQDNEVHEDIRIREGDEEWHIPIKENE